MKVYIAYHFKAYLFLIETDVDCNSVYVICKI